MYYMYLREIIDIYIRWKYGRMRRVSLEKKFLLKMLGTKSGRKSGQILAGLLAGLFEGFEKK